MDQDNLQETKIHGSAAFPYSVYHGRIPYWISSFPLHWHESFELIYCSGGCLRASLWGEAYTLRAGDLLVVLPYGVHSIEQAGTAQGEYYNIIFAPSMLKGAGGDLCYEKYVLPFVSGQQTMAGFYPAGSGFCKSAAPCIQALIANREEGGAYELMVKAGLFQLVYVMNQHSSPAADIDCARLAYSRLKDALDYVQEGYDGPVSIEEAAGRCGFSQSYFMKLFKDFTGKSFNEYLVDYRLELAARQLIETDYRVIDVAENCGFHSHSYFTRAFKRKYHTAPLAYRREGRLG